MNLECNVYYIHAYTYIYVIKLLKLLLQFLHITVMKNVDFA